ncbi:fimbrial biogenesis chaperone [Maribellus maritimus]|uniref:fimbria/pilus periplasmic chaperone n=1 Tax=Maribellus maritimus TaxID=2870838 RepID=UPI001EEA6246|nr:fimbria/pilus periplasmic chaperone [Maribellus maritimus]MCG6188900.1 fimbria/pilus periplasmic chaperone [Maribellus maritimus]
MIQKKQINTAQFRLSFLYKSMLFFSVVVLLLPQISRAQGDLLITPRRVVFEGGKQREEITLANTGQDTAYYSISFLQYRMTEDGNFKEVTEPEEGQMFADPYIRFFPRSVELAPGESQVVRMQLRRMPNMVDGEYRSHLYFRAVPEEKPLGEEDILTDSTAIGIRLTPIFGISIPVIARIGNLSSDVVLSDLNVQQNSQGANVLNVVLNREGTQSVYGDLKAEYITPEGEKYYVGLVKGIAVYTPNLLRRFTMTLNTPEGIELNKGKLLVRYSSSNEAKPQVYDEKELGLK